MISWEMTSPSPQDEEGETVGARSGARREFFVQASSARPQTITSTYTLLKYT